MSCPGQGSTCSGSSSSAHVWQVLAQTPSRTRGFTWHVGQCTVLHLRQREGQLQWLRPMVPHSQLHQQHCHGHLQVQAVLQHLRFCHRRLGGEIDGHQALKLLPEAVSSGAGALLSFSPCHLQAVKALVYLYHLVVQPAQERRQGGAKETDRQTSCFTNAEAGGRLFCASGFR